MLWYSSLKSNTPVLLQQRSVGLQKHTKWLRNPNTTDFEALCCGMNIYPTLISWELFHVQRDWRSLPKAEFSAASAWNLSGEAGIGEFPSILLNPWILRLWIKVFVQLLSKIYICLLHPSTSLLKNFLTAASNFPECIFSGRSRIKILGFARALLQKIKTYAHGPGLMMWTLKKGTQKHCVPFVLL